MMRSFSDSHRPAWATRTLVATLALLAAGASVASPAGTGTYIEAMGSSLMVNSASNADPVSGTATGSAPALTPAQAFHQALVSPASNVSRLTNVPSFADQPVAAPVAQGKPGTLDETGRPIVSAAQQEAAQERAQGTAQAQRELDAWAAAQASQNSVALVQGLPSPKIDIQRDVLNKVAPATPEQVREIMRELYERQGAAVTPPNPGAVGKASTYTVDLSPGATPPVVRVSKGIGAIVNFVDAAGNPWPISFVRNFHAEAAAVTQMAPHVISVSANSPHLSGSVGAVLEGLTTPVTFIVTPGQEQTDTRVDLHIPGLAPGAMPVTGQIANRPQIASDGLTGYLYGATPEGATRLTVQMAGNTQNTTRAWQAPNGKLVLRTPASVVSPGWYQSTPSLDGTTVYELPPTPVVNVALNGEPIKITIDGLTPLGTAGSTLALKP